MSKKGSFESVGASNSLTVRLKINDESGMLGKVTTLIGSFDADIGAVDSVGFEDGCTVRDITIYIDSVERGEQIVEALRKLEGVEVVNVSDRTFLAHLGGKLVVRPRSPVRTRDDLSMVYTPGVARVCNAIHKDPGKAYSLTMKGSTIAIVSDGSRVLGLGNIGALAAIPVMEGKAVIYYEAAGVQAVPICLATQDTEEIVRVVKAIAPNYGGIHLEDIASPRCWEVEQRLIEELDIPVFHDDQHGTAVVVLAGAINAARVVRKQLRHVKVVASGVGAAGMACIKLLMAAGVRNVIGFNKGGPIYKGRPGMNAQEQWLAEHSNKQCFKGTMAEALVGADMFLGLSVPGVIRAEDLKAMARDPIVFALSNPEPEVRPEDAAPYVAVMATGSSEYPNQINNALAFPGIFRGLLDCRARKVTDEMKIAAARAIAGLIPRDNLRADCIIPGQFNEKVHKAVAEAVCCSAHQCGAARRAKRVR
jgi:malate dehydrogenase (oxaloacetate-decarboxylating)